MDFKQLDRGELIAVVGGIVLGISLFLSWYTLGNHNTVLNSCKGPNSTCTAWSSLLILRFLLLITAVAPAILAYIIVRGHALSWPRGELTAVTALTALTFTAFRGLIDKPGTPPWSDRDRLRVVAGVARRPSDPGRLDLALPRKRGAPQAAWSSVRVRHR